MAVPKPMQIARVVRRRFSMNLKFSWRAIFARKRVGVNEKAKIRSLPLCMFLILSAISFGQDVDWPGYLGGAESGQYSALEQITPENVGRLEVAWTYKAGGRSESNRSQIQCNPIVIDGVLFGTSPELKVFALDAATGTERWVFDPFEGKSGGGVNRGVVYWSDGVEARILFTAGSNLYAVDAATGVSIASFGADGRVSLLEGLDRDVEGLLVRSRTPGVIYKDLLIQGSYVNEALPAAPGHVRAYDVRTGEQEWIFHTIPQPGEYGYDTWPREAYKTSGGANSWAGMSVDVERGMVYVPTGSAAYDFYGADRHGENLFANSLIALDASTGKRLWHFQMVHHDLWDRDLPAPPNLVTLERNGRRIDAVAQIAKSAHVFIFDRVTGEPVFPIEEVAFPASDLEDEAAWPTQPIPTKPPPFGRQAMTEADVTDISSESHAYVLERLKRARTGGQFIPPSREGSIVFPGFDGGGEWGGAAVDPESGIMYVNESEMPWMLRMIDVGTAAGGRRSAAGKRAYAQHCLYCHGVDKKGDPLEAHPGLLDLADRYSRDELKLILRDGRGTMPAFAHIRSGRLDSLLAYLLDEESSAKEDSEAGGGPEHQYANTGYTRFVDQNGYPAIKPPWGTLNAIDLNKGEILWKVTLGEVPELIERGLPPTGTENYGGPVVTKGGVIFIGATKDEKFRAFDKATGKLLWEAKLPAGGYATPSTYSVDGRQYVVIACGGGKMGTDSGDAYVAFALRE